MRYEISTRKRKLRCYNVASVLVGINLPGVARKEMLKLIHALAARILKFLAMIAFVELKSIP